MKYKVTNQTKSKLLGDKIGRADSFGSRLQGLMGVKELPMGHGLHIAPCNSIHTFFMRIDIDAIFLTKELKVVHVTHSMVPWRAGKIHFSAHSVLELPSGTAKASGIELGDLLVFEAVNQS
jgi:uncharacterized protein